MKKVRMLQLFALASAIASAAFGTANAATVTGRVLDTKGNPVAGVKVFQMEPVARENAVLEESITDANGTYKLNNFDLERENDYCEYIVAYEQGKWLGGRHMCGYKQTDGGIDITVSQPRTVDGIITDLAKKPIPGVKVKLSSLVTADPDDKSCLDTPTELVLSALGLSISTTDENGVYKIYGVPEHMQPTLELSKLGYATKDDTDSDEPYSSNIIMVPGGSARGRVVDELGNGLGGLQISVYQEGYNYREMPATVTEPDGSFLAVGLAAGKTTMSVTLGDKSNPSCFRKTFAAEVGKTIDLKNISIPKTVQVTAKVVDAATGKPLAGAKFYAEADNFKSAFATANDQGEFVLKCPPGKTEICYAGKLPGYLAYDDSSKVVVSVPAQGLKNQVVKLKKMPMASIKIIDANGKPVPDVSVAIGIHDSDKSNISDSLGKVSLYIRPADSNNYGADPDKIALLATSADKSLGIYKLLDRKDLLKNGAVLKIMPCQNQEVIVKGASGEPIPEARVTAYAKLGYMSTGISYCQTDSQGKGTLKDLTPGMEISVSAAQKGYQEFYEDESKFTVGAAPRKDVIAVTLRKAVINKMRGKVVDNEGNPVTGARVKVAYYNVPQAFSDENGNFELSMSNNYGDDMVKINAASPDGKLGIVERIDTMKLFDDETVLKLQPAKAVTVAIKDSNGKPLEGAFAYLIFDDDDFQQEELPFQTAENGEAIINNIYVGSRCSLAFAYPGHYHAIISLGRVMAQGWKDRVEVTMEPANRSQSGKVIDSDGKPVAGAKVDFHRRDSEDLSVTTDAKGRFTIKGLPDSQVSISATKGENWGYATVSKDTPSAIIKLRQH